MRVLVETANGKSLVDVSIDSGDLKNSDAIAFPLTTEIFDKVGLAPMTTKHSSWGTEGSGGAATRSATSPANILRESDIFSKIGTILTPRCLKMMSCSCKTLRALCSKDEVWEPWLRLLIYSGGMSTP